MKLERMLFSARIVSLGTAASRVLGLWRSMLMASLFGTSMAQSAFVLAFRVPNLFRRLFGEGALSAAFVPLFAQTLEKEGLNEARRLAARVAVLLACTLAMISGGGVALAMLLRAWTAPGASADLFFSLLAIMLPYLLFICLAALCMAILNTFHRYFVPASVPLLLNIVWIAALLWICPRFGESPEERIYGVAWSILLAGAIQLLAQVPVLIRVFRGSAPAVRGTLCVGIWRDEKLHSLLRAMGPVALGMGVFQINVLVDGFLALWVADWAPAALSFAEIIVYLPLGVFATATGTVLLPTLSRCVARGEDARAGRLLEAAVVRLMALMLPAAVGLALLARPVTQLIYEWPGRQFDALSTTQTARALLFYAFGLVVFSLQKGLIPAFYALKDTRSPLRAGLFAVALNLSLNILFVLTWPAEYKHAGIALATVLSSLANVLALAWLLRDRSLAPDWRHIGFGIVPAAIAVMPMAACVIWAYPFLLRLASHYGLDGKALQTVGALGSIAVGAMAYGAVYFTLRSVANLFARTTPSIARKNPSP